MNQDPQSAIDPFGMDDVEEAIPSPLPYTPSAATTAAPVSAAQPSRLPAWPAPKPTPRAAAANPAAQENVALDPHATDVSLPLSAVWGLVGWILFMGMMKFLLKDRLIGRIFLERGWVTIAEAFLACWAVAFMLLKVLLVIKQRTLSKARLLPNVDLRSGDTHLLEEFISQIEQMKGSQSQGILYYRIRQAFNHFRQHPRRSAVSELLTSMADVDASRAESSYTMLRVMIWAIPIIGFIGTVVGLGGAVGGFSASLPKATDFAELKQLLAGVTSGLSIAFDATFVALLISLLLMFPASFIEKLEQDLLASLDEYCHREIIGRICDAEATPSSPAGLGIDANSLAKAIEQAMRLQQTRFIDWWKSVHSDVAATVTQAGKSVSDFKEGVVISTERLSLTIAKTAQLLEGFTRRLSDSAQHAANIAQGLATARGEAATLAEAIKTAAQEAQGIPAACGAAVRHADAVQQALASTEQSAGRARDAAGEIERHLQGAASASTRLEADVATALRAAEEKYQKSLQSHVGQLHERAAAAARHMQELATAFSNLHTSDNGHPS